MPNADEWTEPCTAFARELAAAKTGHAARAAIDRCRAVLSVAEQPEHPPASPGALVGVWRPTSIDGRRWFVRDESVERLYWWADVDRIGPKRGTRVVLLGESCARGYPLDPLFNPASALTAYLWAAAGRDVEVVDLARLALDGPGLLEVLPAAAAFDPDLYVIFAGNNWTVGFERADAGEMAAAVRHGWRAVHACCERLVRAQVRAWTSRLTDIVIASRTPALFVIPAENVQDYPLAAGLHNPLTASGDQIVRDRLLERIDALQREGRVAESEPLAAELVALEDRCSIGGLQALGRCALTRGAADEATRLFEEARELQISLATFGVMSSYVARTEELRAGLAAARVPTVDLPRRFAALSGCALLGREWFFDDCHMTAKGIVEAMAEVARAALPLLGLPARPEALAAIETPVDPRAEAQAACVAALLGTYDERVVRGYVARSLAQSREMAAAWRHYLDVRLRPISLTLCPAFRQLRELERRFPALRYLDRALTDGLRPMYERDAMVARTIAAAIAPEYSDAPARCERLLRRKYAARRDTAIDVLQADVGEGTFLGRFPVQKRRAFVRCLRRHVRFHVVGETSVRCWRFRLTSRVPHGRAMGKLAAMLVNGEIVATWAVSQAWTTIESVYESQQEDSSLGVVTIVWPDPDDTRDDRVSHVAAAFEECPCGLDFTSLYGCWGEIQALSARAVVPEAAAAAAVAVG